MAHIAGGLRALVNTFLTQSFFEVVWQKSIPTQIRQLILYISNEFVWELTFTKRLLKHVLWDKSIER